MKLKSHLTVILLLIGLPFIIYFSCNYTNKKQAISKQVIRGSFVDSISKTFDSFKVAIADFKEVSDFAKDAQAQIKDLEQKKSIVQAQLQSEPVYMAIQSEDYKPSDDKDKRIYELTQKVREYEREIAKLKNRLFYDSIGHISKSFDIVPNEEKPNDKSLVITLDKQLKGDGDISEEGVSVWIIPYNKQSKKAFKEYGNCQTKDLNSLDAKEASYYNGVYFFNDVSPGKYLIKVCALYGNCVVFKREEKFQTVKMLMSPPIQ
jgi:hypothetical protein